MNGMPTGVRTLLLDVDGNLCPSEGPAFDASAGVVNRFLADLGLPTRVSAEELLATMTGRNFRSIAIHLALTHGVPVEASLLPPADAGLGVSRTRATLTHPVLERWAAEEKKVVSDHLGRVLRPDADVLEPVRRLARHYGLAAVSSSASSRVDVCLQAIGLDDLIPAADRFSAEDSLPRPASKPDPAVYLLASHRLGVPPGQSLAVEDSLPGVQSAVAAGHPAVGNVTFVPDGERAARTEALMDAGAVTVVGSWRQLSAALLGAEGG